MYSIKNTIEALVPVIASPISLIFTNSTVRAGAPSPASEVDGKYFDLSKLLVEHEDETFLMRVAGPSMIEYGIEDADLIVVDRAKIPHSGNIVVAVVDGEYTVKKLYQTNDELMLKAGNREYPDIVPREGQILEIWGVVTSCIKRFS